LETVPYGYDSFRSDSGDKVPIYGYRCQSCEQDFEVTQRMSDAPQAPCPVCGGAGKRQFFPIGIHFKGSGFYKTDSRSASASTAASAVDGHKPDDKASTPADDSAAKPAKDAAGATPTAPSPSPTTTPPKAASPAD
jgi:putative FmdB family regulatory protein